MSTNHDESFDCNWKACEPIDPNYTIMQCTAHQDKTECLQNKEALRKQRNQENPLAACIVEEEIYYLIDQNGISTPSSSFVCTVHECSKDCSDAPIN